MYDIVQDGLLPPLDRDAADVLRGSEHIVKAYAEKHSLTATAIKDLISDVLKNPEFNADEVDTDMLRRLEAAIDSGDLKVINMHKEGDGPQILELFARPVETWKRCCANSLLICVWPVTSTLHFASIRIPMVTDYLLEMRTDLYPFNWPKPK